MKKKNLLKILNIFFSFSIFTSFLIVEVSAQNTGYKIPCPSRVCSLEEFISLIGSLIRPIFLVTFGAMIMYGAFLLLTSRGNEEQIENSKKTIMAAIIGFSIAALAPTIVGIITSFLGVEGF